jgi:hypothetical protein
VSRSVHIPAVALAAACLLGGCAAETGGVGWAELGTGEWRFEALGDEQEVPLIAGSQGGFHVWTSIRTTGLDPERVAFRIETEPVDGSRPAEQSTVTIDLEENPDTGTFDFVGWPAIFSEPGCMTERAVHLRIEVTDRDGVAAADERIVVPMPTAVAPPGCP